MATLKSEKERTEEVSESSEKKSTYIPTEEENEVLKNVYDRFKDMKQATARVQFESDIDTGEKQWEGYVEPQDADDYRSNINKPIAFSIVETEMQETIERNSRPKVKPREASDIAKAQFTNDVLNYSFDIGNFNYQFNMAKKETLIRGTGFLLEYYREDKRTVKELELVRNKETKEIEEIYNQVEKVDFDDVYAEYIDGQFLYFDEAGNHIEKCKDMIIRRIFGLNEWRRIYSNKRGFYNIEYVHGGGDTSIDSYYGHPKDVQDQEVEMLEYINRSTDEYNIVVNGVVVRKGPIPWPHKELPVVVLYCYKRPNCFYGKGIPKIIEPLVDERNTLSNLRLDAQKMALNKMFFYDDMIEIDDFDLIPRPHGGIPINTNGRPINQVLQWIEYSDVKPSTYKDEEILVDDIKRTTGVDDRMQGVNMGGTATEAAILKESSMKRINAKMKLMEMDSMTRLLRLRLANIRFNYGVPKMIKIAGKNGEEKIKQVKRTLSIEGKEYKIAEDGSLIVEPKAGIFNFPINKKTMKFLETEFDISVDEAADQPMSKPIKQGKITEMFDRLMANPITMSEVDGRNAAQRYITINEEDPELWLKKSKMEVDESKMLAESENLVMMSGIPIPPTKDIPMEHTEVHMNLTKTAEFQQTDPTIQDILHNHIQGEGAMMGMGAQAPNMGSQLGAPGMTGADMFANNRGGGEVPNGEAAM